MEVEVKAKVRNLKEIEDRLKSKGARFVKSVVQHADYFAPPWKQNLDVQGSFLLRIRRECGKTIFSIKKLSRHLGARIEHETIVKDADALERILLESGFRKLVSVRKRRIEYALGKVHYCLDEVQELGTFVEVEKFSSNVKQTLGELERILHGLGLTATTRMGYVEMLFKKRRLSGWR